MPVVPKTTSGEQKQDVKEIALQEFIDDIDLKVNVALEDVGSEPTKLMVAILLPHRQSSHKKILDAYKSVLNILYTDKNQIPPLKSLSIEIKRAMDVPAHASFDRMAEHGIICFSADYFYSHFMRTSSSLIMEVATATQYEFQGVLVHELTHVAQWNGTEAGPMPGGLIEGLADYVRLLAKVPASHWEEVASGTNGRQLAWDQGYSVTGYFFRWIEDHIWPGFVHELNMSSRNVQWDLSVVETAMNKKIDDLWVEYQRHLTCA